MYFGHIREARRLLVFQANLIWGEFDLAQLDHFIAYGVMGNADRSDVLPYSPEIIQQIAKSGKCW